MAKQHSPDKRVRYRICVASYCEQKPPTDPRISIRGPLIHRPLTQISAKHCKRLRGFRDTVTSFSDSLIPIRRYREKDTGFSSSLQRCGDCGGYFGSSAAARVWCVYINFKRSKKTAPALAGQQSFPTPTTTGRPRTLYPESGDRSQRRGIEESGFEIRGSGYGVKGR